MDLKMTVIGGAGMMGTAIIQGVVDRGLLQASDITVTAKHETSLDAMRQLGCRVTIDNQSAIEGADIVIVAVHPNQCVPVLKALDFFDDQILVSIVTGIYIKSIAQAVGKDLPVVRAMPNVAAVVGQSMTAISHGARVSDNMLKLVISLFEAIGEVIIIEERLFNAATGLAGCGPAFAFKFIESLASGGIKMGLPRDVAHRMAAQVLRGSGELALNSPKHPAALKDAVSSPGGCTIDGLSALEKHGMPWAVIGAVETAAKKAGILFQEDD